MPESALSIVTVLNVPRRLFVNFPTVIQFQPNHHGRNRYAAAITAAVVGVIGNLALWFAVHVLFARPEAEIFGLPDPTSLDWRAASIGAVAALLLFRFGRGVPTVLALSALLGMGLAEF